MVAAKANGWVAVAVRAQRHHEEGEEKRRKKLNKYKILEKGEKMPENFKKFKKF